MEATSYMLKMYLIRRVPNVVLRCAYFNPVLAETYVSHVNSFLWTGCLERRSQDQ